ncbi:nuclear transport factor 2 family protein [Deinococcus peraridilitoris]|uniref:Uncharacterized protein n=1 Tax=Deinococcus peraridilitoris (strain DSM 19664 / LMG 22246 / CIP 109416 / KR-200) TaxID=937777 RepID=L0A664_DEIPD|nr:nuclear transport factor 2 family protein [Deinococcus peraridilitoris]AFZ69378.1 hypothetical protein Deipe_3976 [Deinococcus peraridilitoris DSM 19664]
MLGNDLTDLYLAAWNAADETKRATLLRQVFTSDGRYIDPLTEAHGVADISVMIGRARAPFAAARFQRSGDMQAHHDFLRFSWEWRTEDSASVVRGTDVAQQLNGRFQLMVGFFDQLPAARQSTEGLHAVV